MEANHETPVLEGPYWDFSAVLDHARYERDMWARLTAKAVLDGRTDDAAKFAGMYQSFEDMRARARDRYEVIRNAGDDNPVRWLGYRHLDGSPSTHYYTEK